VNALQIGVPAAAASIIGVANHVSETRSLAAKRAFHCHDDSSPILVMLSKVSSLANFTSIRTSF
jgi:hypothetical protein